MNDLISVIINVYNGEKYIKKCVESIIGQTYQHLEILIINDGSTDRTLEICESFNDSRIRIISTKNQGLSLSRNVGIENAKGEYLYFVDADDFIEKDTIRYLYKLIKDYNAKISTCNFFSICDYNFSVHNEEEQIKMKTPKEMISEVLLFKGRSGTIWNKLIKKELLYNIRFESRIVNDIVVIYKIYMNTDKIIYSNQIKYYYLRHSDSIEGQRKKERTMDMYKASIERYYYIKEIYPDFIENEVGILLMIFNIYLKDYEKISDFYKKEKIKDTYNKFFTLKILNCNMRTNDKIKLILFRISPKLSKIITNVYVKYL